MNRPPKAILVENDQTSQIIDGIRLAHQEWELVRVADNKQALTHLTQQSIEVAFCQLECAQLHGLQFVTRAKKLAPECAIVVLGAAPPLASAVKAMKLGAHDVLQLPANADHVRTLLDERRSISINSRANGTPTNGAVPQFDGMIGQSLAMQRVFETIESTARSEVTVFISGESGTGKELVARSIHTRSSRSDKPFVPVNCSALPEHLFEAELFGYEKGAFTGATRRKPGLLEIANGGTFFLDEVCELPLNLQAKLLRVLQENNLRRVGGHNLIPIDVRLISASNRDLAVARQDGLLRDDFYFRLNVINIELPPLRNRREDIPLLAQHFLHKYIKSSPKSIRGFTSETLDIFMHYGWPGNVRELENVIERAIAFAKNEEISPSDLPDELQAPELKNGTCITSMNLVEAKHKAIEEVERNYLLASLAKHHGNVTKIAEEAGMTRRNLHRLLNRYGLHAQTWRATDGEPEKV